jgi:hypothetical protein
VARFAGAVRSVEVGLQPVHERVEARALGHDVPGVAGRGRRDPLNPRRFCCSRSPRCVGRKGGSNATLWDALEAAFRPSSTPSSTLTAAHSTARSRRSARARSVRDRADAKARRRDRPMTHSELTEVEAAAEIEAELPSPSPDSPGSRVVAAPHEIGAASRNFGCRPRPRPGPRRSEVALGERRGRHGY